jgi:predicted RNA-binding protein YlqC (UPF0109 family)
MGEAEKAADALVNIVRMIVDTPEEVSIESITQPIGVLFRLSVATSDVGKVIGKDGRTAQALRVILSAVSKATKQNISLNIQPLV